MSQSPITLRCTTVLLSLLSLLSLFPFTYTLPTDVYLSLSLSTSPPNGLPKSNDRAILDENPCTEEGLFYDGPDCDRFLECTIADDDTLQADHLKCDPGEVFNERAKDWFNLCVKPEKFSPDDACYKPRGSLNMASKIPSLASVGDAERKEALAPIGRHEVKAKELKCTANSISRTNECTKEGFFRNEDDCTKFYRCVDSGNDQGFGKYTFECGPGTVFDPSEITCNHPWNLDPADACYSSPPSLNIASKKTTPLANVGNAERKEAQAPIGKHGVKSKDL